MKLSIVIATYNGADILCRCLDLVYKHTCDFEVIVVDNDSKDNTLKCLLKYFEKDNFKYIRLPYNLGFGVASNIGAKASTGDYICCLNNDMFVAHSWAEMLIGEIEKDPMLGQVGSNLVCNRINAEGDGYFHWTATPEYIEGALFVIPRAIYEEVGLFDEDFRLAYYEDSDLSLRIRRSGYSIKSIHIPGVIHLHKQTSAKPEIEKLLKKVRAENKSRFTKKWGSYLETRRVNESILIKRNAAIGDVFLLTPVIRAIKERKRATIIDVQTAAPGALIGNPDIRRIIGYGERVNMGDYDEVFDLDLAYEKEPKRHIVDVYAEKIGVTPISTRGILHFSQVDINAVGTEVDRSWVVIDLGHTWPSRLWSVDKWNDLVEMYKDCGYNVVSLGSAAIGKVYGIDLDLMGKTTIHQAADIISRAGIFVAHDGLLAHLAQAVNQRCVLMWGCTKPEYRTVADDPRIANIMADIECQGCHHDLPAPRCHTDCERGDNACMAMITVEEVFKSTIDLLMMDTKE